MVDDGLLLGGGADAGDGHVRVHGHQDRALLQLVHLCVWVVLDLFLVRCVCMETCDDTFPPFLLVWSTMGRRIDTQIYKHPTRTSTVGRRMVPCLLPTKVRAARRLQVGESREHTAPSSSCFAGVVCECGLRGCDVGRME